MTTQIPSTDVLKAQARRLRADLAVNGKILSHGAVLEMLAHQWGARDWNTLSARASLPDHGWAPGDRVSGVYLGQRFTGAVKAARMSSSGMWSLTLRFDAPVDVVTSARFSNMRQQVNAVVDRDGICPRKTSDGQPHLVLDPRQELRTT